MLVMRGFLLGLRMDRTAKRVRQMRADGVPESLIEDFVARAWPIDGVELKAVIV